MSGTLILMNFWLFLRLSSFTISAEVEEAKTILLPFDFVYKELGDLSIYQKHFPGIIEVKRLDEKRTSWTYEVEMPLAKAARTTYILEERSPEKGIVIFESPQTSNDYMFCMASIIAREPAKTELKIKMILKTVRDKGSDVHFLAPLLGQNFISGRMKEKVEKDLKIFLEKVSDDFYTRYNNTKR